NWIMGPTYYGGSGPSANVTIDSTSNATKGFVLLAPTTGNVGVGTTGPTEKLHVVGNLRVQGTTDCTLGNGSGGTACSSDIRLKDHVQPIQDSSRKIASLRGVEFDWNEKSRAVGTHAIGVIAQEVEKVFPTAVMEDASTGYKKVDYAVLVAPLIQAFNEMGTRVANLFSASEKHEAEIAHLKLENAELKARMDKLERALIAK
ncbi:MAG: tail fiber domain-containing protein, partial [Proteobacteria bacterium]